MTTRSILLGLAMCGLALGQQKEQPPEGGPPRPFHLAQTQDFTLANGMKATIVAYGMMPRVAIRAFVQAGGVDEKENEVWLSRLTGLLMKEGTKSRSGEQLAQEAADAGGQIEIAPGVEFTSIGGVALSDHAAQFISLVADVLLNPSLPASQVARLKTDLARELAVAKTQPGELAQEKFLQTLYPGSPYGRLFPKEAELQAYTLENVRAFYQANFSPERTHLYIAGRLDPGLRETIEAAFARWPKGGAPVSVSVNPVKARSFSMIDRPGAAQSTLYIGLPIADPTSPDYIPLDVMNTLLGGSFASRITSNIREQKGYTYSPTSQIGTRIHEAYWVEMADVTTAVTGPSMKEIFSEVERLRKEPPSPSELKGFQTYLAGLFVLRNTLSPDAVIGQLHFVDSQGLNRSFLTDYVRKVIAVKPQDVQGMAEKYLAPDKMSIVVVGDKSKIEDQVKPFQAPTQ
ncbi:MAG: insulinase family protein [Acidobacteriaceae bacterium]|nr:insulinase family protein [Acidobacteriaceae bacterium]